MRKTGFLILVLATVAVVLATFHVQHEPGDMVSRKDLLFPGLDSRLDRAAEVQIGKGESSFVLHRQGEASWHVRERADYPANRAKIYELLLGSAGLQRLEEKTHNPKRYGQLGLAWPDESEADEDGTVGKDDRPMRIAIRDGEGQLLAGFFLGKRSASKGRRSLDEMYVRIRDDPTVWLVEGSLPLGDGVTDWLQKDILKLDHQRIQEVRITHTDGEEVTVRKDDRDATDYHIVELPETAEPKSPYTVNSIATRMANLTLQDVRKKQDVDLSTRKPGATVRITTFGGPRIIMSTWESGEDILVRLDAHFDPQWHLPSEPQPGDATSGITPSDRPGIGDITTKPASDSGKVEAGEAEAKAIGGISIWTVSDDPGKTHHPATGVPTVDPKGRTNTDAAKEAADLAERWRDWVYVLPKYRLDSLTKRMSDLVKE
uniref:DUF4340 domain-containing protein n=1 Tax=Candidatus Kentrum eta TaxID=2126337 RepID=A0A450UIB6_9GAMM|nr:MAG: protein of unknown function (DUF4340) [Candidatus Kentron sp. H]VFJ93207.1 MAG: protein of unknown function (DUF4340) [Candidatus Kentron sp. H]VFK00065.1 MAG: protein of unknown function (DUF4340) [Candidatus Kentron sp. H]